MRREAGWLGLAALLTSCYLSPDKSAQKSLDASTIDLSPATGLFDASLGASTLDSGYVPTDAGCATNLPFSACPESAPVCSAGACVACKQQEDCAHFAATPVCGAAGACVVCDSEHKALCSSEKPACEPSQSQCVQWVSGSDCLSDKAPACKLDHTCGLCTGDTDCARFGKVCDTRIGSCVSCRPESEEADCRSDKACDAKAADCPGTACDPKTFSCTTKLRGSVAACQACVSDSECINAYRCVPLAFGEGATAKAQGGFCLKRAMDGAGCTQPYATPAVYTSLSGVAGDTYCSIPEATTTCAAIKALDESKLCPSGSDDSCGALGARCKTVNFISNACTYSCRSNRDCAADVPCSSSAMADRYCGGPQ